MNRVHQTLEEKLPKNDQFIVKGIQICLNCLDSKIVKYLKGTYCTKCNTMWPYKNKIQKKPVWGDYIDKTRLQIQGINGE